MDPELKREIEEIHSLARDNHQMLRAIRRGQMFGFFWKIIVWAVVLLLPIYFYQQYLQPIVEKITSTTARATTESFGLPSSADLQKLINSLQGK